MRWTCKVRPKGANLIIGIGGHLVSLPLGFSGLLAGLLGAEALGLDTGIGHKATPAVGTSTLSVTKIMQVF
jgi:hypothetical protein